MEGPDKVCGLGNPSSLHSVFCASLSVMDVDKAAQSTQEKDNVELAMKFGRWDSAETTQDPVKLVQPEVYSDLFLLHNSQLIHLFLY